MANILFDEGSQKDDGDKNSYQWIEQVIVVLFPDVKGITLGKKYFNVVNCRFKCNREQPRNDSNNNREDEQERSMFDVLCFPDQKSP